MKLNYQLIENKDDNDLNKLLNYHNLPEIKKFISLSEGFFDYVINNENVFYYKVMIDNELVDGLQIEKDNSVIYLALWVKPEKQHRGIATCLLEDVLNEKFVKFNKVIVSIDKDNQTSIALFTKIGFKHTKQEDELIYFEYKK